VRILTPSDLLCHKTSDQWSPTSCLSR